jgi:alkylhydroperoxidase family enzyme
MVTETVTPRIAPLAAPFDPAVAAQLEKMMPGGAPPIALFKTFVKNLPMAEAMGGWGGYELSRRLSLSMRDREIVINRTCARCGCEYEWGVHVAFFSERVDLDAAQVSSLVHGGPADPCWITDRDRLLVRAVDSLHDHGDIDDELWEALAAEFDEANFLDLLLLCGWYHAISFAARAARVPREDATPTFASVRPASGPDPDA